MSIVLLTPPNPTPATGLENYENQNAYITATLQAFTGRMIVDGITIHGGTVIKVADVVYKATSDTTITGAESNYVKITPSGSSATASFVATLSGVTWNHAHGQYMDGSGNVYLFDEGDAYVRGDVSTPHTISGKASYSTRLFRAQNISVSEDVSISGEVNTGDNVTFGKGIIPTYITSMASSNNTVIPAMIPGESKTVTWTAEAGDLRTLTMPSGGFFLIRYGSSAFLRYGSENVIQVLPSSTTVYTVIVHRIT